MKKPEEIKKGLSCTAKTSGECMFTVCPYRYDLCMPTNRVDVRRDALSYIQQLEADKDQLLKKIKQLEKERDAAISDMGTLAEHPLSPCDVCKHLEPCDKPCERALQMDECFEWRGVCEESEGNRNDNL